MKVLHVMPSVHPRLGGPSAVIFPMLRAIHNRGVSVSLITTGSDNTSIPELPFELTLCKPSAFSRKEFIPSFEFLIWLNKNIAKFDLVHCHFLFTFSTTAAAWFCRRRNIPYLIRPLGHYAPWSLDQHSLRKQVYLSLIEKQTLAGASAFHATSLGEAEALRQLLPASRIVTIPLGVTAEDFTCELTTNPYPEDFVILVLGRVHPKKRVELLLQSIKHYQLPNQSKVRIVIAGEGEPDYVLSLRTLASELPQPISVDFLGYVQGNTKAQLLQRADLALCLSHHENFAVAVAESLSIGCPVVVTEGVQIAPLIERYQCGKVIDGRESSVIEAIRYYHNNPDLRREHGSNGCKLAESEFAWPKIGIQIESTYERVLADFRASNKVRSP